MDLARNLAERTLTTKEYAAWNLRENHGYSYRAIAINLGVSLSSARERIKRADDKMRHAAIAAADAKAGRSTQAARRLPDRYCAIAKALLIERDGPECYLCHTEFATEDLEIEHIIPRTAGGLDEPSNLALACSPCNLRKGSSFVSMLATSGACMYHRGD